MLKVIESNISRKTKENEWKVLAVTVAFQIQRSSKNTRITRNVKTKLSQCHFTCSTKPLACAASISS